MIKISIKFNLEIREKWKLYVYAFGTPLIVKRFIENLVVLKRKISICNCIKRWFPTGHIKTNIHIRKYL